MHFVIVDVAVATGRQVLDVARDSFALTLYTFWHLEQRRRLDALTRKSERFDLAGLMAQGFHSPKELPDRYSEFLATLKPATAVSPDRVAQSRARQLATIRAAHSAQQQVTALPLS